MVRHHCQTCCQSHRSAAALAVPHCDAALFNLSYPLPPRWPLDAIHLVMETQPGTCDIYRQPDTCCKFTSEGFSEPERHIREAIVSLLGGCARRPRERPCRALDLGAK